MRPSTLFERLIMKTVKGIFALASLVYALVTAIAGLLGLAKDLGRWLVNRKKTV